MSTPPTWDHLPPRSGLGVCSSLDRWCHNPRSWGRISSKKLQLGAMWGCFVPGPVVDSFLFFGGLGWLSYVFNVRESGHGPFPLTTTSAPLQPRAIATMATLQGWVTLVSSQPHVIQFAMLGRQKHISRRDGYCVKELLLTSSIILIIGLCFLPGADQMCNLESWRSHFCMSDQRPCCSWQALMLAYDKHLVLHAP